AGKTVPHFGPLEEGKRREVKPDQIPSSATRHGFFKWTIFTECGISGGSWIVMLRVRLRFGSLRGEEARAASRAGPGGRVCGRRLVISAKPRTSCTIFIMLIRVAMQNLGNESASHVPFRR